MPAIPGAACAVLHGSPAGHMQPVRTHPGTTSAKGTHPTSIVWPPYTGTRVDKPAKTPEVRCMRWMLGVEAHAQGSRQRCRPLRAWAHKASHCTPRRLLHEASGELQVQPLHGAAGN